MFPRGGSSYRRSDLTNRSMAPEGIYIYIVLTSKRYTHITYILPTSRNKIITKLDNHQKSTTGNPAVLSGTKSAALNVPHAVRVYCMPTDALMIPSRNDTSGPTNTVHIR